MVGVWDGESAVVRSWLGELVVAVTSWQVFVCRSKGSWVMMRVATCLTFSAQTNFNKLALSWPPNSPPRNPRIVSIILSAAHTRRSALKVVCLQPHRLTLVCVHTSQVSIAENIHFYCLYSSPAWWKCPAIKLRLFSPDGRTMIAGSIAHNRIVWIIHWKIFFFCLKLRRHFKVFFLFRNGPLGIWIDDHFRLLRQVLFLVVAQAQLNNKAPYSMKTTHSLRENDEKRKQVNHRARWRHRRDVLTERSAVSRWKIDKNSLHITITTVQSQTETVIGWQWETTRRPARQRNGSYQSSGSFAAINAKREKKQNTACTAQALCVGSLVCVLSLNSLIRRILHVRNELLTFPTTSCERVYRFLSAGNEFSRNFASVRSAMEEQLTSLRATMRSRMHFLTTILLLVIVAFNFFILQNSANYAIINKFTHFVIMYTMNRLMTIAMVKGK